MAAPIMSATNNCIPLVRLLLTRNGNIIRSLCIRKFSDGAKEENCDFFGIPEDYKLEHYRHHNIAPKSKSKSLKLKVKVKGGANQNNHEVKIDNSQIRKQDNTVDFLHDSRSFQSALREKVQDELAEEQMAKEITTDFNYIENQYFGATCSENSLRSEIHDSSEVVKSATSSDVVQTHISDSTSQSAENYPKEQRMHPQSRAELNLFDEYYFGESLSSDKSSPTESTPSSIAKQANQFNVIDDQYFGKSSGSGMTRNFTQGSPDFNDLVSSYINKDTSHSYTLKEDLVTELDPLKSEIITNRKYVHKKKTIERTLNPKPNLEEPATAFDLAMKIRNEMNDLPADEEKHLGSKFLHSGQTKSVIDEGITRLGVDRVDEKGFRILSNQVPNFYKMPSMDVVDMLKKKVIFDHEDFMVIDKPYGLPTLGQENDPFSLSSLLPSLCEVLPRHNKATHLHLVNGLDRDVTGAVMLAKNPEVAYMLRAKLKANEIIQRFWAITKGVPSPREGFVDIPIGEGKVGNIYRMVLRPQYKREEMAVSSRKTSKAPSSRAVTEFKVLSSHLQTALLECRPHTYGVKHQLRVHLSSGLNTPVLGDHKYSHFSKLAPQKLDRSTLELLKVRQAKVRHIALHLHCHSLVLPDYKSRTFVITSHLPSHFIKNMKSLKLRLPK